MACVCTFSRALRGWGCKHFHRSFPPLVGFFLVQFLIHRGLQKKFFLWGAGCRWCRQGRHGSRSHHPTHHPRQAKQTPTKAKARRARHQARSRQSPASIAPNPPKPATVDETRCFYKGLLAGFNGSTHHPKQTATPQIKPAEPPKAGRQASTKPTPPEARRAKQGKRGRHTLNAKHLNTPPAT